MTPDLTTFIIEFTCGAVFGGAAVWGYYAPRIDKLKTKLHTTEEYAFHLSATANEYKNRLKKYDFRNLKRKPNGQFEGKL